MNDQQDKDKRRKSERPGRSAAERERAEQERQARERAARANGDREDQERERRARERVFTERMDRDRAAREGNPVEPSMQERIPERGPQRTPERAMRGPSIDFDQLDRERLAQERAQAQRERLYDRASDEPVAAERVEREDDIREVRRDDIREVRREPARGEAIRREAVHEEVRRDAGRDDLRRDDIDGLSHRDMPAGVQQRLYEAEKSQSRRRMIGVIALIVLAAAAYWGWLEWQKRQAPAEPVAVAPAPAKQDAQPAGPPPIQHPIAPTSEPLPALADSDAAVTKALGDLVGAGRLADVFVPGNVVRKIVASVDNAGRQQLYTRNTPLKPPPSSFMVSGTGDARTINPRNSARYAIYAQVVEQVDAQKFGVAYQRYYPLFQQAYEELGYPGRYFNDRLVEVIDLLLATPDAPAAPTLVQPKVNFEYADPRLESLTAGQKALIRMGPTESARVKAKLREIRSAITAQPAQAPSASAEKGG